MNPAQNSTAIKKQENHSCTLILSFFSNRIGLLELKTS